VRAELERAGTPIGPLDTLIASHALSHQLTLITNNDREFRQVPSLSVENWLAQ
jgi:tRNA(fMet)-specific endonuclease VapC